MRKPTICICEYKDADQLRGNREADQRLCFRYRDGTIFLLSESEACFCDCTGSFVLNLFGNNIVGFLMRRLIYSYYKMYSPQKLEKDQICKLKKICLNNNMSLNMGKLVSL